jgi:type VI secretion system protein ImpH
MADACRLTPHSLSSHAEAKTEFDFFHVLRRLENRHRDKPRIGRALRLAQDMVRLGQAASLAFPSSAIASVDTSAELPRVGVHCFGMLGPNGALPLHFTEYVWQRAKHFGDHGLGSFLDLFHHRMLSFFYRAWADANPAVQGDRPDQDRFAVRVSALFGLGSPSLRDRDALPDSIKRYYAGQLADQARHPEGLLAMITDHFGMPAHLEEFVGEWIDIPEDCLWKMGDRRAQAGGMLGLNTTLGSRVWLRQGRFQVVLGPLTRHQFTRVAPGGALLPALVALVRTYVGDSLRWDLRLELKQDAVPPLQLGSAILGQTAWLWTIGDARQDALVFEPARAEAASGEPRSRGGAALAK